MPKPDDIQWFKASFGATMAEATHGLPFGPDLLTALACQETGLVWSRLRQDSALSTARLLALCVGDTVEKSRRAFPRSKAELLAVPQGERMFAVARAVLVEMAARVPAYAKPAALPDTFCHGYGVFQRDLQYFRRDPEYFLSGGYADFGRTMTHAIRILNEGLQRLGWQHETSLDDHEQACLAIVYNTGRYLPAKGLRQGWFDGEAYYGERIFDYLRMSRATASPDLAASLPPAAPNTAALPLPTPIGADHARYVVATREGLLRLRREPRIPATQPLTNVLAQLPPGQLVVAVAAEETNGFLEVETSLDGAWYRGYVGSRFLRPAAAPLPPRQGVMTSPEADGHAGDPVVPAVILHGGPDIPTTRAGPPNAFSLNERGQPVRTGATPAALRSALTAIADWLDVAAPTHQRYQARGGAHFGATYAHDYCHLAGVYLPRAWWTPGAIERVAGGESLAAEYGGTVEEQTTNALFRWLREFGPRFGWRQTGALGKLQLAVNQGAVGLVIARRAEGKAGSVVVIVPETAAHAARRDAAGEVIAPLESGAARRNFRYRASTRAWWQAEDVAEWAWWLHA